MQLQTFVTTRPTVDLDLFDDFKKLRLISASGLIWSVASTDVRLGGEGYLSNFWRVTDDDFDSAID